MGLPELTESQLPTNVTLMTTADAGDTSARANPSVPIMRINVFIPIIFPSSNYIFPCRPWRI